MNIPTLGHGYGVVLRVAQHAGTKEEAGGAGDGGEGCDPRDGLDVAQDLPVTLTED